MSVESPSLWAVKNYRIPAKCKKDLCSKVQKGSFKKQQKGDTNVQLCWASYNASIDYTQK